MARDSESWAATSARSLLATCLRNTSVRHIFSLDGCNHKYIAPRQAEGKRACSIAAHRKNGLFPGLPQSAVLEHIDSRELRSIPESRVIDVEVIAMSEDMQGLGGGTGPLMFRMPCAPGEEMECIGDGKGDCLMAGREIPAVDTEPVSTVNAPPSSATYPWPSMKRRYGSPSCSSMSYWARAMGTSDVPTLYGLEKVSVEELVGPFRYREVPLFSSLARGIQFSSLFNAISHADSLACGLEGLHSRTLVRSRTPAYRLYHAEASSLCAACMPNPLWAKANGRIVYAVPLIIFMDAETYVETAALSAS
ncbi:hypothetical protein NUW54_g128 [Trametes sanguinea]|uniref:Uncharacterized protein n=1 Tax=Trametes sanguinea TaxID=158606 RepID=A0ACC1QBE0_9APHY|nr:hypothetical protein NUW54_g128 [Trametes sanguinea]